MTNNNVVASPRLSRAKQSLQCRIITPPRVYVVKGLVIIGTEESGGWGEIADNFVDVVCKNAGMLTESIAYP